MKYWPLSEIVRSPLIPRALVPEFHQGLLSQRANQACGNVLQHLPACDAPQLVIVQSIGTPPRRLYVGYPEFEEWLALERGGAMQYEDDFAVFMLDALH